MDRPDRGARPQRRTVASRGGGAHDGQRLMPRALRHDRDDVRAGAPQCQQSGEAHVLRAHHEGPPRDPLATELDELLQHARGHDSVWPRPCHEARRPRTLAAARRQHDHARRERVTPGRARHLEPARGRPARDHRVLLDARACPARALTVALGVAGAGHDPAQVAHAEALMSGVPRDAARPRLALEHEHAAYAAPAQLDRAGEPRGPAADDHDRVLGVHHGDRSRAARSAETWAPQKNPWQRPISTRVRRRSPSRSTAGTGALRASAISPRVTRSQKHTISP